MKQFFKTVLAVMVAIFLVQTIAVILLVSISAGMAAGSKTSVKDKTVLKIDFSDPIADKGSDNPLAKFGAGNPDKTSQEDVLKALRHAAKDDKVAGIVLTTRSIQMGLATTDAIRNELEAFRKSGKFIKAYSDVMTEGAYYLCSVADEIYLAPEGLIELNGIGGNQPFLKGMLAKLEVEPEIFRVGKYKSAIEPLILDKMSDANRQQTMELLNSVYGHMIEKIAVSRKKTAPEVRALSDSFLIRDAKLAKSYGMVDHVAYYDELEAGLHKKLDIKADDKINYMSLDGYMDAADDAKAKDKEDGDSDNRIAVIYAEGSISTGSSSDAIGSDDLLKLLRKARHDKKVKAVVLRVNSPGGDALASDVIWREVTLIDKTKPVIASMGDVAASGGYYISMGARKIFAQPTTITGSIGVFGVFFNAQGLLEHKLGITHDVASTGHFSDYPNLTRKLTDYEKAVTQKAVDDIYETFTGKAAQGRHMDQNRIKELAQGRVWSGIEAKQNGLIDELGTLDDAVAAAAKLAGLKKGDYQLRRLPEQENFYESLMKEFTGKDSDDEKAKALTQILGPENAKAAMLYLNAQKLQGIQARMPMEVDWR